jgi:glyceraldehyde 3-phosphate dehydrogenase
MAVKIAINGFGRIGRLAYRAMVEQGLVGNDVEVVAVGDIVPADSLAYLLKYDSTQGRFQGEVSSEGEDTLIVNGSRMKVVSARTPAELPWKEMGVELVVECTGLFTQVEKSQGHIEAGAKKVIISAPAKGDCLTVVMGVNHDQYDPAQHHIVSNASCTTNCLAPVAQVILDNFGIKRGLMTTVHAYTGDQRLLDFPHSDLRRARAAAMSMIPTNTGAAAAVALVIPELKNKFDGLAVRVPTPDVSLVDVVIEVERETSVTEVNNALREADGRYLRYCEEPLVSIDFQGDPHSSIVDGLCTRVLGTTVKVMSWYDNEWGYSNRMLDLVLHMDSGKPL